MSRFGLGEEGNLTGVYRSMTAEWMKSVVERLGAEMDLDLSGWEQLRK